MLRFVVVEESTGSEDQDQRVSVKTHRSAFDSCASVPATDSKSGRESSDSGLPLLALFEFFTVNNQNTWEQARVNQVQFS